MLHMMADLLGPLHLEVRPYVRDARDRAPASPRIPCDPLPKKLQVDPSP